MGQLLPASTSRPFKGSLDELRVFQGVYDEDRATAESNNQLNNDVFWFKTPLLENGVDNFLVDDMGRNIVAAGQ